MANPSLVTVSVPTGKDCFAYVNTAVQGGTFHSTPTWLLVDNIMDLDQDPQENESFKATIRRSGGVNLYVAAQTELGVKFKTLWIPGDPICIALLAAFQAKKALDMVFLDGVILPAAGFTSQGWRADWLVMKMPRAEHLSEALTLDIELKPGVTANPPSYMTVVGS